MDNPHGSDLLAAQYQHGKTDGEDESEDGDDDEGSLADQEDLAAEFQPIGNDDAEVADVPDPGTTTSSSESHLNVTHKPSMAWSTMPSWLGNEYVSVHDRLTVEMEQTAKGRPKCYDDGTFYTGVSGSPYLLSCTMLQIRPGIFHQPIFCVWLPHCLLGNHIPCPSCKRAGRKASNSTPMFLQRLGWVDVDKCIYIIGYHYRCGQKLCNKTYHSWSPAILDILPLSLSAQFSFCL